MPKASAKKGRQTVGTATSPYATWKPPNQTKARVSSHHQSVQPVNLIRPKTAIGQHFLKNPAIVTSIVQKAAIKPTDTVLEIGPGTGNMTLPLLQQAKNVVALEYDNSMIREVLKRVEGSDVANKLRVIQGDAIQTAWPFFDVMVANLPYQISSPCIFKLLSHRPMFRCAVIMLQEEFALRLTARPGEALYCRLSVNTQLLAKVDQLLKVGKQNFRPPPKVESRVVRIELKNPPPLVNFAEWDGMIRLLFNRKNKTLRGCLMTKSILKLLQVNRQTVVALSNANRDSNQTSLTTPGDTPPTDKSIHDILEEILEQEPWKGQRASKMNLDDFLHLLAAFNNAGIHFSS